MEQRIVDFLAETDLFKNVKKRNLEKMVSHGNLRIAHYEKGRVVRDKISAGELTVILCGTVSVMNSNAAMRQMAKGSVFGVAGLFGGSGSHTKITAKTRVDTVNIPEKAVRNLLENDSVAALNYICFLTDRINFLNSVIDRYTGSGVEENLKKYLENVYERQGDEFNLNVSAVAKKLNVGRRSVYRGLNSLTERGILKKDGKNIKILQPERLLKKQ
jgi:signal-transduction protein with cAMP-binding, CBS, and nucleotidyltransferase domain